VNGAEPAGYGTRLAPVIDLHEAGSVVLRRLAISWMACRAPDRDRAWSSVSTVSKI
jgi:hypothetical protein